MLYRGADTVTELTTVCKRDMMMTPGSGNYCSAYICCAPRVVRSTTASTAANTITVTVTTVTCMHDVYTHCTHLQENNDTHAFNLETQQWECPACCDVPSALTARSVFAAGLWRQIRFQTSS
jgi:hypothetical protein